MIAVSAAVAVSILLVLAGRRIVRSWLNASQVIAADKAETEKIRFERAVRGNGSAS
jgi:hypothetical protein